MPIVSKALIDAGRGKGGGLSRGQVRLLTGRWVNLPGWEKRIIGKEIDQRTADLFLRKFPQPSARPRPPTPPDDRRRHILRHTGARRTRGLLA